MVAVLGGFGFIGSHLCRELVSQGRRVRIIGKNTSAVDRLGDFANHIEALPCDICETDSVLNALEGVNSLIHLAHSSVPQDSSDDPNADIVENLVSAARLASRLGETGVEKVIFVSTGGAIYGPNNQPGITESSATNPISSYGITKLAAEKYFHMYCQVNEIRCLIARPANVYGPAQRMNKAQGLIGTLAYRALQGITIEIWGNGSVIRDYIYVDDLVVGLIKLLDYRGSESVFNIGTNTGATVSAVLQIMKTQLDKFPPIIYKPGRNVDVPSSILDSSLLERETGWRKRVDLEDGISRVIKSFR